MLEVDSNGFTKMENEFKLANSKNLSTTNMYLFNDKGQITKYSNIEEIIYDFYKIRLDFYKVRKDYQISKLEEDIKYLEAKVKFINEIISGSLIIYNKTKKTIEKELEDKNYPKKTDTYDYLITMPIYNLTAEKKLKLEEELNSVMKEYEDVKGKTCQDMWISDINDFEVCYEKYIKEFNTKIENKLKSKSKSK
jgi:DNA topoisomerase-2